MQESLKEEWANVIMTTMVKLAKIAETSAFHAAEERADQGTASLPQHHPA